MKQSLFITLIYLAFTSCQNPPAETKQEHTMTEKPGFFHNVYFFINPASTAEDIKKFEEALSELGTIDVLIDYHIGKPAMTPRDVVDNSYQYSIITSFKNKDDHDVYQVHPVHDAFRAKIEGIVDSVRIYDSLVE